MKLADSVVTPTHVITCSNEMKKSCKNRVLSFVTDFVSFAPTTSLTRRYFLALSKHISECWTKVNFLLTNQGWNFVFLLLYNKVSKKTEFRYPYLSIEPEG